MSLRYGGKVNEKWGLVSMTFPSNGTGQKYELWTFLLWHQLHRSFSPIIFKLTIKPNIRLNKSQNLNDHRLVLQLPLPNPLKPGSEWRCGWSSADRAMLQLHLSDQQFYCLLRCGLYQKFNDTSLPPVTWQDMCKCVTWKHNAQLLFESLMHTDLLQFIVA